MQAAAALKRSTGHRSKEESRQKSKFSETAKKIASYLLPETTNERREKGDANPGNGLCPFLQSCDDVPVRLLLVIGETNNSGHKRVSVPFASLKSSNPALRFLQQNLDGPISYQEATAASLSPWYSRNSPNEGRWSNVNTTCPPSSSSTIKQQPATPEGLTSSRSPSSSYQSPKTSDGRRWESLWKDSRPPDIAYRFHHYSDIHRYIDQYRKDHVHRRISPRTRQEDPIHATAATAAAAAIRPVVPPLCSVSAPIPQSFQDPAGRPCLTQHAFRFSYARQRSDLSRQQRISCSSRPSARQTLARRRDHDQEEQTGSSFAVDTDNGERRCSICRTLHSTNGDGDGDFSLPKCKLRVCRKRNSVLMPAFLTYSKKNATSNAKDRSPRLTLPLPSKYALHSLILIIYRIIH